MTPAQAEWARCREWFRPVVERDGRYSMKFIEDEIAAGRMHLWPCKTSAAITEFIEYPEKRVLNVFAVAGQKGLALRELTVELEPRLVAFGQANGCQQIRGEGLNPNWKPVCENMGYRHQSTVMVKDI